MLSAFNKIYIGTNGCIEGQLSSKQLKNYFKSNGKIICEKPNDAELIIFYACGLTQEKEESSIKNII